MLLLWLASSIMCWIVVYGLPKGNTTKIKATQGEEGLTGTQETGLWTQEKTTELAKTKSIVTQPTIPLLRPHVEAYKCRHRHSKYSGGAKQISPKLLSFTKRYNRLHDKFMKQLPPIDSLQLSLLSRNNTVRYLYLKHTQKERSQESMATEMYSLLSAYLLALLTDRVLLIDNYEYRQTMCEPFASSSWFVDAIFKNHTVNGSVEETIAVRRPVRALQLNPSNQSHRITMQCTGSIKETFSHVQWLIVQDNAGPFIDLLLNNNAHSQRLWEMFPDGSMFAPLYHAIIHPSNMIWQDLPELLKGFSDASIEKPIKMTVIGDSSRQATRQTVDSFSSNVSKENDQAIALLISPSDSNAISDAMNAFAPPSYLLAATAAHFSSDSVLDRYGRFFADIFLAMHSDYLLFDQQSTFGWLSHAVRRKKNSVLFGPDGDTAEIPIMDHGPKADVTCPV